MPVIPAFYKIGLPDRVNCTIIRQTPYCKRARNNTYEYLTVFSTPRLYWHYACRSCLVSAGQACHLSKNKKSEIINNYIYRFTHTVLRNGNVGSINFILQVIITKQMQKLSKKLRVQSQDNSLFWLVIHFHGRQSITIFLPTILALLE